MTNNRKNFNQCTALVFEILYQVFPLETDVNVENLGQSVDEEMMDNYFATIRFLQREGLIRYQELHYSVFKGVTLTAKGLNVLDTIPNIITEEKTVAQQISHVLQEGSQTAIGTVIQELIKLSV